MNFLQHQQTILTEITRHVTRENPPNIVIEIPDISDDQEYREPLPCPIEKENPYCEEMSDNEFEEKDEKRIKKDLWTPCF